MDPKQFGVLKGMGIGAICSILIIFAGVKYNPLGFASDITMENRIKLALKSCLIPALCLAISIGRLASLRFFSPKDIDGSSSSSTGTSQATILQSIIQNTLEQSVLATIVYLAWSVLMPGSWLSVVRLASFAFGIGRLLFTIGYGYGAPSRATGFALTFYSSVGMLLCLIFSCVTSKI